MLELARREDSSDEVRKVRKPNRLFVIAVRATDSRCRCHWPCEKSSCVVCCLQIAKFQKIKERSAKKSQKQEIFHSSLLSFQSLFTLLFTHHSLKMMKFLALPLVSLVVLVGTSSAFTASLPQKALTTTSFSSSFKRKRSLSSALQLVPDGASLSEVVLPSMLFVSAMAVTIQNARSQWEPNFHKKQDVVEMKLPAGASSSSSPTPSVIRQEEEKQVTVTTQTNNSKPRLSFQFPAWFKMVLQSWISRVAVLRKRLVWKNNKKNQNTLSSSTTPAVSAA